MPGMRVNFAEFPPITGFQNGTRTANTKYLVWVRSGRNTEVSA